VSEIRTALETAKGVNSVIHLKTLYLGPDEIMLGAKIAVSPNVTAQEIAQIIDDAESSVRTAIPAVRLIYLEPDILRG
jgi:divalent metal cation (Fe/Co/Zn/Cd) transporter